MKVKIGDAYYDSADIPIMLIIEPFDRTNLQQMLADGKSDRYMAFRGSHFKTSDEAQAWMDDKFKFMTG